MSEKHVPIPDKYLKITEKLIKSFEMVFKFMEERNIHTYDHAKDMIFSDIEKILIHAVTGSDAADEKVIEDVLRGTRTIEAMNELKSALGIVFGEEFMSLFDEEIDN